MSLASITEAPLPGEVNPFERFLPDEMVERVLDSIDTKASRLDAELTCKRFASFAPEFLETGEEPNSFFLLPISKVEFYPLFKRRMKQLNVEFPSDAFMLGIVNFNGLFLRHTTMTHKYPELDWEKLYNFDLSLVLTLYDLVFEDAIQSYADQDIEKMTRRSFSQRSLFLQEHYTEKNPLEGEFLLRRRIKQWGTERQAKRTAEIEALRQAYDNPAPDDLRFLETQRGVIEELEEEKKELEKKRLELWGPHGCDGTINAGYHDLEQATANFSAAVRDAGKIMSEHCDEIAASIDFRSPHFAAEFLGKFPALPRAQRALAREKIFYEILLEEHREIVKFDQTGRMIGGKLFRVLQQLQPDAIIEVALERMRKVAIFFGDLNRDVVDEGNGAMRLI